MNENIKNWVDALRSGKYKQTDGTLKEEFPDGSFGYCCLGVKAEIENNPNLQAVVRGAGIFNEGSAEIYYKFEQELTQQFQDYLMELNDEGESFEAIANIIEEKFKE